MTGSQPPYLHPPYVATRTRSPRQPLVPLPPTPSEWTGPALAPPDAADLTRQLPGEPLGQRIVVAGRVVDEDGRPVPRALVEVWQANAAGRYRHDADQFDAPLDPSFLGAGRTLTDADGRYRFITVRPGAYPWRNHPNAWRPAHIHFSLFGPAFAARLVTQMYFEGDPLLAYDPIFNSIPDERARAALVAAFDWEGTEHFRALGYRFDIVLGGRDAPEWERES